MSIKAGVDVYAMFPVLKAKIFDVAISQWAKNKATEKESILDNNTDTTENELKKKNENKEAFANYTALTGKDLDYKILLLNQFNYYNQKSGQCELNLSLRPLYKDYEHEYLWFSTELNSKKGCDELQAANILGQNLEETNFSVSEDLDSLIRNHIARNHRIRSGVPSEDLSKKNDYIKTAEDLWSIFVEFTPIIRKIPKVKTEDFKLLEEAQEILNGLISNTENKNDILKEKAKKHLMMLSSLKLVAHAKNAFNFNSIKNPKDLLCKSNENTAREITEGETDAFIVFEMIDEPEFVTKNKELFEEFKTKYKTLIQKGIENPALKEERIKIIQDKIDEAKNKFCEIKKETN